MSESPLRLRRIADPASGSALLLSFTAGMEVGVAPGMADLPGMVIAMASTGHLTAAVLHAGVEQSIFSRFASLPCGTVVDLFGGTWMTSHPERREQICSLEHAVRVGADAVLATVSLGSSDESRQLRLSGQVAHQCRQWGMPLVVRIDTTETDASRQFSATLCGHGARLAYELGADLVAVNYPGQAGAFAEALRGIDIPVLVGGAPNIANDAALLQTVEDAVSAGAAGVLLTASIFWDGGPTPTLEKLARLLRRRPDTIAPAGS